MKVHQNADPEVSRHIDSPNDPTPRVLVDRRDVFVRCSHTEVRSQSPIPYRESDSVDPNVSEVLEVGVIDESIPVSLVLKRQKSYIICPRHDGCYDDRESGCLGKLESCTSSFARH